MQRAHIPEPIFGSLDGELTCVIPLAKDSHSLLGLIKKSNFCILAEKSRREFIEEFMAYNENSENVREKLFYYVIVSKGCNQIIGLLKFYNVKPIFWSLNINAVFFDRNAKFICDGMMTIVKRIFEIEYIRIEWLVNIEVIDDLSIIDEFGFSCEAARRRYRVVENIPADIIQYSIIKEEWPKHNIHFPFERINMDFRPPLVKLLAPVQNDNCPILLPQQILFSRTPEFLPILYGRYVDLASMSYFKKNLENNFDNFFEMYKECFELPNLPKENMRIIDNNIASQKEYRVFWVIEKKSGKLCGKLTFTNLNIDMAIMGIRYSPSIRRTTAATEAFYLFACYVFEEFKIRRLEWLARTDNEQSLKAAMRYGFQLEGTQRKTTFINLYDIKNTDEFLLSMLDNDWPMCKKAFDDWLNDENFDESGFQKRKLADIRLNFSAA